MMVSPYLWDGLVWGDAETDGPLEADDAVAAADGLWANISGEASILAISHRPPRTDKVSG
jgi:hypothetical protein